MFMILNGVGHDAPDAKVVFLCDLDGLKSGIGRNQINGVLFDSDKFQGEFTIDVANGSISILRIQRLINDQDISVQNSRILHGLAFDPTEKSGGRIRNQLLVQVEF